MSQNKTQVGLINKNGNGFTYKEIFEELAEERFDEKI